MFYNERYDAIISILTKRNGASVHYLANALHVSEPTIRRDLTVLEQEGRIKRSFGGAVINESKTSEISLMLRESEDGKAKNIIARKAAAHISDGSVIFLDASSTVSKLIPYLSEFSDLTVITNGPKTSMKLAERHIKSFCTGGYLLENSVACVGKTAEEMVSRFHADVFFFSGRGISLDGDITDSSIEESELRQVMMRRAEKNVFLCTHQKIGTRYFYRLCHLDEIDDMICDTPLPPELSEQLSKNTKRRG